MNQPAAAEQLRREIGVIGLAAGVANFIVGAGIFVLPALVAAILGSSSLIAYLLCGVLLSMIMLCFAEIGSQITVSGGPYAYAEAAFGPYAGFVASYVFWLGYCVMGDAAIANAMADMLSISVPALSDGGFRLLFFVVIFGLFSLINIRGVKHGVTMVKTVTLIKLAPLVLLVVLGTFWIDPGNLSMQAWPSSLSMGEAAILLFFAFGGGEGALSTGGEIKDPARTVPRGLLLGVGTVIVLYIGIQTVTQGILGADLANYQAAPLAETAGRIVGPAGTSFFLLAAAVSIFGTLSGSIVQYPRILYASGLRGSAPGFLARVHPRYATPYVAIVAYALLDLFFASVGGFTVLATLSSATLLLTYLGVVAATIRLRLNGPPASDRSFRMPLGLTIPVASVVAILWFLSQLPARELMGVVIFLAVLSLIYLGMMMWRRNKTTRSPA